MSSFAPNITQFAWLFFTLLLSAAQIVAAVLLLRDRGAGPLMMLIGSVMSLIGGCASHLVWIVLHRPFETLRVVGSVASGIGGLGSLLFVAGLLIFALQRRALQARIAELERVAGSGQ
jgi:hypothetical protein